MEFSKEELVDAIDRLVTGLLERAGVVKAPVNALQLAEDHLGIPVEVMDPMEEDERGRPRPRARAANSTGIVLATGMTDEQEQKAAAEGIALALMPEIFRKLNVAPGSQNKPLTAHVRGLVVARLLVPNRLLRAAMKECRSDLLALKTVFTTATEEAIALRWLDLDQACVISIVDDGIVTVRRGNRLATSKKLEPAEQNCLDRIMELDQPCRVREGEWTVQGWPIADRPSRRIILRAIPDDI